MLWVYQQISMNGNVCVSNKKPDIINGLGWTFNGQISEAMGNKVKEEKWVRFHFNQVSVVKGIHAISTLFQPNI